ncbi:hypothetical protein WUBG_10181 [Wuchereria bancrofti]|uniref:Uncharacterized protein n=1 Tax=Wuchereria bancrofti TaxID=6293 RepID=J9EPC2_WUCBA|nr:hypothetical protein WUBG_10181 [Wuchereria bancrofti]
MIKRKLDISSKFHAIQHPEQSNVSVDRTASQATSSPSQIITAVLKKDSVEKTDTSLHVKSGDKKLDTNLHHKKEPLGTSEYDEDNGKRGKFGLFHFWRSKDKESNSKKFNSSVADMNSSNEEPKNHTTNLDSFHDKTNIRLTIKSKKKPITSTTDVKTNELAPSINMKEESLNRTSPSDQSTANAGMKKTAFIHLKRDSELANDLPLDSNSNAGIVTPTGISSYTLSRTNEGSKPSSTEKSQLVDKENNIRSCESTDESNENSLKSMRNVIMLDI